MLEHPFSFIDVSMSSPDYLLIGHVSKDLTAHGPRLGGTVTFGSLMANALGYRPGILTSASDDFLPFLSPLNSFEIKCVGSSETTTFTNQYTPAGRLQKLSGRAAILSTETLPLNWAKPRIVHFAPIADEIGPEMTRLFPDSVSIATPQGWMRIWDKEGLVKFKVWESASEVLPRLTALVMSIDDVQGDETLILEFARLVPVLAVTRSHDGARIYIEGKPQDLPAPVIQEIDPTGAGDIFAVCFGVGLLEFGDPYRAATFAILIASDSVTRHGIDSIPGQDTIQQIRTKTQRS